MVTISLCMIVRDEADTIARCLASVADLVDEIILVDTGSVDATKEIAKEYTDQIYDFPWIDDFAAARNYSFSFAKSDFCMWLDADDVIEEVDRDKFQILKKGLTKEVSVVMLPYHTGFDELGNVTYTYFRERIIQNHANMSWVGAIHEVVEPRGKISYGDAAVSHRKIHPADANRNLRIFEKQMEGGTRLDTRQQFYYGRELYYHKRYQESVSVLEAFLNEENGWLENRIDACCHCAYCYKALGETYKAIQSLFRTLEIDLPRAEVCCEIGMYFFESNRWKEAAFWYTIATTCQRDESRGGFTAPDCYAYLPCIQLCVCYSRMGELEKAIRFNELAATFKPESEAVIHNRSYFQSFLQEIPYPLVKV